MSEQPQTDWPGLAQYAQDYDGFMMGSVSGNLAWPSLVQPYVKSSQVFTCPSAVQGVTIPDARLVDPATGGRSRYCGVTYDDGSTAGSALVSNLSYGRNFIQNNAWASLGFTNGDKTGYVISSSTTPVNDAAVADPAGTIHIFDSMTGTTSLTVDPCSQGSSIRGISPEIRTDHLTNSEASKVAPRHFEGFSALFGDGHAKFMLYGTTTPNQWSIQADS